MMKELDKLIKKFSAELEREHITPESHHAYVKKIYDYFKPHIGKSPLDLTWATIKNRLVKKRVMKRTYLKSMDMFSEAMVVEETGGAWYKIHFKSEATAWHYYRLVQMRLADDFHDDMQKLNIRKDVIAGDATYRFCLMERQYEKIADYFTKAVVSAIDASRYDQYVLTLRKTPSTTLRIQFGFDMRLLMTAGKDLSHPSPREKEQVMARKLWSDVVSHMHAENQRKNVKADVIKRLKDSGIKHPEVVYQKCIDYLRTQTTVVLEFNASRLKGGLTDFQALNMWEKDNRQRSHYTHARKRGEQALFKSLPPALKTAFFANQHALPRYARLCMFGRGVVPASQAGYGKSFVVLKESVKLNALFCPGDSLDEYTRDGDYFTPCTVHDLANFLWQADDDRLNDIVSRVTTGKSSLVSGYGYIEAQIPAIDFTDPNMVESIYIHPDEWKLSAEDIEEANQHSAIRMSNSSDNVYKENLTRLFSAIQNDNASVVSELLNAYPSLAKMSDSNDYYVTHQAARYGSLKVLGLLVAKKLDFTMANYADETPLDVAKKYSRQHAVAAIERILGVEKRNHFFPFTFTSSK